ncbi:DUF4258 domain-containing protein [Desulfovibrio sp. ZJ200]|uniref:DUF4258 domain-containing protein n=1 Tax=Desulfovibrio sp. ZJ200 TaxID=2709792 RepID=UPI0013E9D71D|nr:DUF4258 domain-containing protein [Desulfovibrio sp. ZJ200]
MNLTFSAHALNRCLERDISLQRVADAILAGTMEGYGDRRILTHGRLRVVAVVQDNSCFVVTAFRLPNQNPKRHIQKQRARIRRFQRERR